LEPLGLGLGERLRQRPHHGPVPIEHDHPVVLREFDQASLGRRLLLPVLGLREVAPRVKVGEFPEPRAQACLLFLGESGLWDEEPAAMRLGAQRLDG
jgi:hypothetical protein